MDNDFTHTPCTSSSINSISTHRRQRHRHALCRPPAQRPTSACTTSGRLLVFFDRRGCASPSLLEIDGDALSDTDLINLGLSPSSASTGTSPRLSSASVSRAPRSTPPVLSPPVLGYSDGMEVVAVEGFWFVKFAREGASC